MSVLTLYDQLQEQVRSRPDKIAVVHCQGAGRVRRVTFAELGGMARKFAASLAVGWAYSPANSHNTKSPVGEYAHPAQSMGGYAHPSVIPIFMGKSPACIAAMFGAIGAGSAFACLNRKLRPPQINAILGATGPGVAITDGPGATVLAAGLNADSPTARMRWWVVEDEAMLPAQRKAVEQMRAAREAEYWSEVQTQTRAGSPCHEHNPCRIVGCCLFTSGSTGRPKGVLIAESDLRARAAAEIECFGITADDVLLNVLPFSFDVGLNQVLTAILAGCTIVLLDSWLPADIIRATGEFKVTGISAVPAIWSDMLAAGLSFDPAGAGQSLRYLTISGGDMAPQHLQRMPALAGKAGIFKTYGQTEAFRATSLRPEEFAARTQSVGRPFGSARIYIVRENGSRCEPNEQGEIVHTGLGTMLGYLDADDPQSKLRPNPFRASDDPADVAIFTGDLGWFDEQGYLYVKGRRDEMLKVAGNRVYPQEVVAHLLALGGIAAAEVVGVKSESNETTLVAFVVLASGAAHSAADIRRQLANRVSSYMVPREVVILPAMPRTASGKPDRPALLERAKVLLQGGT